MVMSEARFGQKPKAVGFSDDEYYASLQYIPYVEKQLDRHIGVIRKKPSNDHVKICVDEWGCWHDTGNDSNWSMRTTMRDAIIAAATLNTFNSKCNFIEMAALCMTLNALHSILLTRDEQLVKTPYLLCVQAVPGSSERQTGIQLCGEGQYRCASAEHSCGFALRLHEGWKTADFAGELLRNGVGAA